MIIAFNTTEFFDKRSTISRQSWAVVRKKRRLTLAWVFVFVAAALAHVLTLGADPVLRMVAICVGLLLAMKNLVYVQWSGENRSLTPARFLIFTFCWFGMDPGSFAHRRAGLSWRNDVTIGLLNMVLGTLGAWLVWRVGWHQVLLIFIPMSLGFHFGALRVLKGGLRATGFPVRTLFPNPLKLQGFGDFWARRWNVGYSQMMQRVVGRPMTERLGAEAGNFAAFLVSGLLHELAITLPVGAGYGLPTLFFAVQGTLVWAEKKFAWRAWWLPWAAGLSVVLFLGVLFPPTFQEEVLRPCLHVFEFLRP